MMHAYGWLEGQCARRDADGHVYIFNRQPKQPNANGAWHIVSRTKAKGFEPW